MPRSMPHALSASTIAGRLASGMRADFTIWDAAAPSDSATGSAARGALGSQRRRVVAGRMFDQ